MARGTIRYWAAARAAAGVAEEPYDAATLADALAAARAGHGPELVKVLTACSYVVDGAPVGGRDHATVELAEGGSVEVLPPFAGGAAEPVGVPAGPVGPPARPRTPPPVSRHDLLLAGVSAGLVAGALAGLAVLGTPALAAGMFVVQVVLALAWLASLDAPGGLGAFAIAIAASGAMDGVVAAGSSADVGRAAGVVGVAVVVSLLHQLARRPRPGVTLSMAGTVSAVAFAVCGATFVALRVDSGGGDAAAVAALLGTGAALLVARGVDLLLPRPVVLAGSRRGVAGVVAGLGAAVATGWGYGTGTAALGGDRALRLALVTAGIALIADLAVDAVLSAAPPADDRSRSALPPLAVLLPVVLAGPAAYVAGRILLG